MKKTNVHVILYEIFTPDEDMHFIGYRWKFEYRSCICVSTFTYPKKGNAERALKSFIHTYFGEDHTIHIKYDDRTNEEFIV